MTHPAKRTHRLVTKKEAWPDTTRSRTRWNAPGHLLHNAAAAWRRYKGERDQLLALSDTPGGNPAGLSRYAPNAPLHRSQTPSGGKGETLPPMDPCSNPPSEARGGEERSDEGGTKRSAGYTLLLTKLPEQKPKGRTYANLRLTPLRLRAAGGHPPCTPRSSFPTCPLCGSASLCASTRKQPGSHSRVSPLDRRPE